MTDLLTVAFLLQMLRISAPYVLAALGGMLAERGGVIHLALEGLLLGGAFTAALFASWGGVPLGLLGGLVGGLVVAGLYTLLVVRWRADQIVSGVAVNLLVLGLTRYGLKLVWGSASSTPTLPGFDGHEAELFLLVIALLVIAVHVGVNRTPAGLRLRAVGDHPEAADSLGVDVVRVRSFALLASGLVAGLGGAWLALDNHGFVDRMSGGRGYIALAAMIVGRWQPLGVALACLGFGLADAVQLNLQGRAGLPRELVQMLPYLVTLAVLAGVIGRTRPPSALGRPWWGR